MKFCLAVLFKYKNANDEKLWSLRTIKELEWTTGNRVMKLPQNPNNIYCGDIDGTDRFYMQTIRIYRSNTLSQLSGIFISMILSIDIYWFYDK